MITMRDHPSARSAQCRVASGALVAVTLLLGACSSQPVVEGSALPHAEPSTTGCELQAPSSSVTATSAPDATRHCADRADGWSRIVIIQRRGAGGIADAGDPGAPTDLA